VSHAYKIDVQLMHFCECIRCGVPIFGPEVQYKNLHRNHENFYCINGHAQHWPGESDEEKLRKQVERLQKEKEWAEQAAKTARQAEAIAKGKQKAHAERVKNGVCPCCTRSFTNLRRHMATKHPEFKP
jgi:hypothetical protein